MSEEKYFLKNPEILEINHSRQENDLAVLSIGYHNFHFVKPLKHLRQQQYSTLHFVISGEGTLNVNGKSYHIYPHDVFWLDTSSLFSYYPDPKNPWEYVFINFYGNMAETYMEKVGFSQNCHVKKCLFPQQVLSSFYSCLSKNESGFTISNFEFLSDFFCLMNSLIPLDNQKKLFDEKITADEIKYFIQLKYLEQDFTIAKLCEYLHISHSHLCRCFKKNEHMTIMQYISNLKMNYVEGLLINTDYTIFKISILSGYQCYEHFLRLFKKTHKMTPTEFREKNKN